MCEFLSAIATRDGRIFCNPLIDSHKLLIEFFSLREGKNGDNFVTLEFSPADRRQCAELAAYQLKLDDSYAPSWWDDDREAAAVHELTKIISRMIVREKRILLFGGAWILADGADVATVSHARVVAMAGTAQVDFMSKCEVDTMMDRSSIKRFSASRVNEMRQSSRIGRVLNLSRIEEMCDSATLDEIFDGSAVGAMNDVSKIGRMRGRSSVGLLFTSAKIDGMFDYSQVGRMSCASEIAEMEDHSRVEVMMDSSSVHRMAGHSSIEKMEGSSKVHQNYSESADNAASQNTERSGQPPLEVEL